MDSPRSDIEKYVSKDVPVLVWHSYHANDNSSCAETSSHSFTACDLATGTVDCSVRVRACAR